jgi:hypothetical protein
MRVFVSGARAVSFVLAACVFFCTCSLGARAAQGRHLYLASTSISGYPQVLRFRMVNGFPARTPDLVYTNVSWPMVIAADGTFYATIPFGCCFGQSTIDVFPPNSANPSREVTLPQLNDATYANAIAVAPNGYMYVGYDAFISGAGVRSPKPAQSSGMPQHGVAVYPPDATGSGPPPVAYKFKGIQGGPASLVWGPQGHLYVAGFNFNRHSQIHGYVFEIVKPWSGPNIVGHLDLGPVNITGMAFSDETRDLYMLSFNRIQAQILVYPRGELGQHPPARTILMTASRGPSVAIDGNNAFTTAYGVGSQTPQLVAYPKHANGSPKPTFLRNYNDLQTTDGVVIGP